MDLNLIFVNIFQQLCAVRDQLATETAKHKEFHEAASHKMKAEETHRITAEEHVEKLHHENNVLKAEHFTVSALIGFNDDERNKRQKKLSH